MAMTLNVWPYAFMPPGPAFSATQKEKEDWSEMMSVPSVDLIDYPIEHEVLGVIAYFTGPFSNTKPIRCQFGARNAVTNEILFTWEHSIPTPQSQGYEGWNWYKVKFWIGHCDWEINGPMRIRLICRITEGDTVHYDQNLYIDVVDTSTPEYQYYSVDGTPSGAEIWEGSNFIGTAPMVFWLSYTDHYLTFKKEGYSDQTTHVETHPEGDTINVEYNLNPIPCEDHTTEEDCIANGCYWYNDSCHSVPQECTCTEWENKECISDTERRQERVCNPSGCDVEERIVEDESCYEEPPTKKFPYWTLLFAPLLLIPLLKKKKI